MTTVTAVAEALHRAADEGRPASLSPELCRKLLQAGSPGEIVVLLGLDRASRVRRRNHHLVEAARILATDGAEAWTVAGRLATAVARFERALLPAIRRGADPELSPHEQELAAAWRAGAGLVASQRRLFEMLRED